MATTRKSTTDPEVQEPTYYDAAPIEPDADGAVSEVDAFNIVQPVQDLSGFPLPLDTVPVPLVQDPHSGAFVADPAADEKNTKGSDAE